jgi:hypothetical protein
VTDTTGPTPEPTPVTEPLHLADQRPVNPTADLASPSPAPKANHTRTILEVVGAVVAVFLILGAGTVGFVAGHATSNDRGDRFHSAMNGPNGPLAGGQGQRGDQGFGQGGGMMGGQGFGQGFGPGQGGGMMGGQDPRGIDPDGDNWTGGGQGINPNAPSNTTPQPGQTTPSGT